MAASLWWETVAHLLGWLPSFGIIGKRRGEEQEEEEKEEKGGGVQKGGPFNPVR